MNVNVILDTLKFTFGIELLCPGNVYSCSILLVKVRNYTFCTDVEHEIHNIAGNCDKNYETAFMHT